MLRRRSAATAACLTLACAALSLATAAPAAADPPAGAPNDIVVPTEGPPAADGPASAPSSAPAAPAGSTGPGYDATSPWAGWQYRDQASYTLRLVANSQGNVETMRAAAQAAAAQVRSISGVSITVAPGTVADASPDRAPAQGEILLSIDDSPPSDCLSANWAGCGGTAKVDFGNDVGIATIGGGRIWIRSTAQQFATARRNRLVAHELGHTLGLNHYSAWFEGAYQVMHPSVDSDPTVGTYRSGDQNGLRFLKPTPCAPTNKAPTRALVRAGYADFFGRVPTQDELDLWTAAIATGAACRHDLFDFLASADPYLGDLVNQGFQEVFGRNADPSGKSFWIGKLRSGEYTVGRFHAYLYSSNEFWVDAGSTNGGFIDRLYQRLYGRNPDSGGRAYWVGKLDGGTSRYSVASSIYASSESGRDRVDRVSNAILGRTLDGAGRDYWVGVLASNGGDDIDVAVQLALSSEYFNRAQTRF